MQRFSIVVAGRVEGGRGRRVLACFFVSFPLSSFSSCHYILSFLPSNLPCRNWVAVASFYLFSSLKKRNATWISEPKWLAAYFIKASFCSCFHSCLLKTLSFHPSQIRSYRFYKEVMLLFSRFLQALAAGVFCWSSSSNSRTKHTRCWGLLSRGICALA